MPAKAQQKGKGSVHTIDSLAVHFGIKDMGTKTQPQPHRVVTTDDEYYSYVNGDLWDDGSDPLKFWEACRLFPSPAPSSNLLVTKQSKRKAYPTIFAIAMDYLPIQASAVPCERMLKYDYKECYLTFTEGTKLDQRDLLEDEPEELDCDSGGALVLHQEEAIDALIASASQEEGNQLQADIILADI
ncbi:hypothetical protein EDC04DRAFT_2907863 [Pisolithus marmoratus]|nr:hypothetical protein EDC04DRAFT_2907863 [Pisolithus marmoratus]